MEDQVAGLANAGVPAITLGGSNAGNFAKEEEAIRGEYALVYIAPEKAAYWENGLKRLQAGPGILGFAVDEAVRDV